MSSDVINKEKWVLLFRKIGLDDETMRAWHHEFEARYPRMSFSPVQLTILPCNFISGQRTCFPWKIKIRSD